MQHEEASAKVQRQIIEWRRVELHKIFSEELEEATRMGEMERSTAKSLQHQYFDCQVRFAPVTDAERILTILDITFFLSRII